MGLMILIIAVMILLGIGMMVNFVIYQPNVLLVLMGVDMTVVGLVFIKEETDKNAGNFHSYKFAIYSDKVVFLKGFKQELTEIGFDKAYLSEYEFGIQLYHVEFSDDGQYYQTHKTTIATFSRLEAVETGIDYYIKIINTLIQAYHQKWQLTDKMPMVNFISRKPPLPIK